MRSGKLRQKANSLQKMRWSQRSAECVKSEEDEAGRAAEGIPLG